MWQPKPSYDSVIQSGFMKQADKKRSKKCEVSAENAQFIQLCLCYGDVFQLYFIRFDTYMVRFEYYQMIATCHLICLLCCCMTFHKKCWQHIQGKDQFQLQDFLSDPINTRNTLTSFPLIKQSKKIDIEFLRHVLNSKFKLCCNLLMQ